MEIITKRKRRIEQAGKDLGVTAEKKHLYGTY